MTEKEKNEIVTVRLRHGNYSTWVADIVGTGNYVNPNGTTAGIFNLPEHKSQVVAETARDKYLILNGFMKLASARIVDTNPKDVLRKFGHPAFYKLLDDMAELHSRKNHDYAGKSDPLKNLRACVRLDLEPFMGVMVRLQDKWSRLEEFVKSNELLVKNESVIDTLMDNAVYSLLAIILYQEQLAGKKE